MYPTTIGKLQLPHFIYNAAGVWDTTWSQCKELNSTEYCGAVVTKSCTQQERAGNNYPKYHFSDPHFSINSNGLENFGLQYYLEKVNACEYPIFISIGGLSDPERIAMIIKVNTLFLAWLPTAIATDMGDPPVGIELNLSCPNIGCPGAAYNPEQLDNTLRDMFNEVGSLELTFGLKLPPYYLPDEFVAISKVLKKYQHQIDFITCINSIPNGIDFDIDNNLPRIEPNGGYGGIGGPALLPVGLANVRRFSKLFRENCIDIAVIGCGGVTTGADAYKYLLAGASAVQIGTHLWKNGPGVFKQVSEEFQQIINRKGYQTLEEVPRC